MTVKFEPSGLPITDALESFSCRLIFLTSRASDWIKESIASSSCVAILRTAQLVVRGGVVEKRLNCLVSDLGEGPCTVAAADPQSSTPDGSLNTWSLHLYFAPPCKEKTSRPELQCRASALSSSDLLRRAMTYPSSGDNQAKKRPGRVTYPSFSIPAIDVEKIINPTARAAIFGSRRIYET